MALLIWLWLRAPAPERAPTPAAVPAARAAGGAGGGDGGVTFVPPTPHTPSRPDLTEHFLEEQRRLRRQVQRLEEQLAEAQETSGADIYIIDKYPPPEEDEEHRLLVILGTPDAVRAAL